MSLLVFVAIAALLQSTQSAPTLCVCTREYLPICGSDDSTYSNNCMFQCEREKNQHLEIKFYGQCDDEADDSPMDQPCFCTDEFFPVCGSDDQTYSNECMLNCEQRRNIGLARKYVGECGKRIEIPEEIEDADHILPVSEENCVCTLEYFPVCGSDDQTYSNECMLNCGQRTRKDLKMKYLGECGKEIRIPDEITGNIEAVKECVCARLYTPICGTDGKTYANSCTFNCAKLSNTKLAVKSHGECNDFHTLPIFDNCICPTIFAPVCGSDGRTYSNKCFLLCEQKHRTDLTFKHFGECEDA